MREKKRIVVVEDEPDIAEIVREYLERDGFSVEVAGTVTGALDALQRGTPDALLLDITLPDGSGLDVLRAAALPEARVPTIMLTARADEADRIIGLELGADDYVTKPFSPREVLARVRSLLRRTGETAAATAGKPTRKTRIAELEIDHDFHELSIAGKTASLTATEFKILALLAENPGEVFTRSHLLDRLGDDGAIYERTLDRHINNLRKKIEKDPRNPEYVLTVYGTGYKMRRS
ncbi:MAG: response regulator transcription factor [Candidatus Eremiobacteraeota bacterium]|nr:response regulator transcription factor [Candidatus Eremiobacteraeota bacterium]MBV8499068.1 response regulator transcription factor [Candidatus Eremiobacteraeota bacterium]